MARNVEFDEAGAVRKAMEVFWSKGYNGTTMRDLTDAMKINSSSLYNTLGDKHELFLKCIKLYTEIRRADLEKRLAAKKSAFDILTAYIYEAVDTIVEEHIGCLAVKAAFEVAGHDPRVKAMLQAYNDDGDEFLKTLIRQSMADGKISAEEDPQLLADYFNSTWTGWYESYILHREPEKIRKMAGYFIRQLAK